MSQPATPNSIGINGTLGPDVLVRWERRDNRIFLRNVNYRSVASDSSLSSPKAMNLIQFFPILASFNVAAYGPDSAAVIEDVIGEGFKQGITPRRKAAKALKTEN